MLKYEIFNSNDTLVTTDNSLYSLMDLSKRTDLLSGVQIDTTVPSPALVDNTTVSFDYKLKIKATAEGGAVAWKEVTASIVVCRNETLSLNQTGPLLQRIFLNSTTENITVDLPDFFRSSDPYCEPYNYTLKTTNGNPTVA